MTINNLLFTVQNMAPAMLGVGAGQTQNYANLSDMMNALTGDDSTASTSSATDTVSLTYQKIGQKVVTDLAGVTAQTIKDYPDLDKDYVIAIVDNGATREARVYRRADILKNFTGSDKEKAALQKELDQNPLMVFYSDNGLPETASDAGSQALAKNLNSFLKTNAKTMDVLGKAGYDPLADLAGSSSMRKTLTTCAGASDDKAQAQASQDFMAELNKIIADAVKQHKDLDKDYIVTIIDDGGTREARVYRRSDILENFKGTDAEREALKKQLESQSILVFNNANGLPESAGDGSAQALAASLNSFLASKSAALDGLDKSGDDPLADYLGSSTLKKILANYAEALMGVDDGGDGGEAEE
jgi:hypothetical protein